MAYVGEIRMFGGNFAPAGWMLCNGQVLAIAQYSTLFNLIGTTYGGDGQNTFALPDLRGRLPVHMGTSTTGTSYVIGEAAGVESVTLTTNQIPAHNHSLIAATDNPVASPNGAFPGPASGGSVGLPEVYGPGPASTPFNANIVQAAGGSQPHDNIQPFLCVNFIISMFGVFPSQF